MTEQTQPIAPAPIQLAASSVALYASTGPDGTPLAALIVHNPGLFAATVNLDAGNLDTVIEAMTKLRADMPGRLVVASAQDTARVNGRG